MALSIGVDVGGTFTDLVSIDVSGEVETGKVLSTPDDQSRGVERALLAFGAGPEAVGRIVHGTTVVTNMLLERAGSRVVLCATEGASDLLELRRQERASLYDLTVGHPEALVPPARVVNVRERRAPEGVLIGLTAEAAAAAAERVAGLDPEIVAISLLHAYQDGAHERALAEAVARRNPGVDVVCSHDVLPEIREYERTATTCCEAYARPGVQRYLERLSDRLNGLGMPAPGVVASSGGMSSAHEAARAAATLALSGPAGGVAGAALVARLAGFQTALSIDIGGTSADAGLILDGEPLVESGGQVAGVPIALPRVLVETVSAGGGSIGWIDEGGALRVGPRSAGAVPGPVAFGRGGSHPTLTDAQVTLGNIRAEHMSDEIRLDVAAARLAVGVLAQRLGVDAERTAEAMVAAADAAVARALRRVSVERGIDPRACVLVAFGGGGPLHACGLAERLGMTRVLVPPFAGVLSALGLAVAPERRVAMTSVMRPTGALKDGELSRLANEMAGRTGAASHVSWIARTRYRGQGHELEVPFDPTVTSTTLAQRFATMHNERYGFTLQVPVEIVSARCQRSGDSVTATLARRGTSTWREERSVDDGNELDLTLRGPRVVALRDATMLVAPGWTARSLPIGGWLLERS